MATSYDWNYNTYLQSLCIYIYYNIYIYIYYNIYIYVYTYYNIYIVPVINCNKKKVIINSNCTYLQALNANGNWVIMIGLNHLGNY